MGDSVIATGDIKRTTSQGLEQIAPKGTLGTIIELRLVLGKKDQYGIVVKWQNGNESTEWTNKKFRHHIVVDKKRHRFDFD